MSDESELRAAALAFVEKFELCQPAIVGAFTTAWIHGDRYTGPNYGDELKARRRALNLDAEPEQT